MIIIIHYSLLFIKIELYCQNCYCNTLTDILVLILKVNCIGRLWNDITNSIPFIFFYVGCHRIHGDVALSPL